MDVKNISYQLAIRSNLPNPFLTESKSVGRKWLDLFLKRHKNELGVRKPSGTSFASVKGFNKEAVFKFFDLLDEEFDKHHYPADHVFNVDETGLSIVQSKMSSVIA